MLIKEVIVLCYNLLILYSNAEITCRQISSYAPPNNAEANDTQMHILGFTVANLKMLLILFYLFYSNFLKDKLSHSY